MNLAKNRAQVEAHHGMELLADYVAWIKEVGAQIVAEENGKRVSEVERYETLFKRLADTKVQEAAIEAQLSFTVVCELSSASYAIRKRKDRVSLLVRLCKMIAGSAVDYALGLIKEMMRQWGGDSSKRPDSACMHNRVGRDGKRRFVACLSSPVAARIDTILHRLATKLKEADPDLEYDHAYAEAFIRKITGSDAQNKELFGPMFMIATDYCFHADGKITTTDGALVDIQDVVNEQLAATGWAAVTGTTDDNAMIPLVGAFVKVHRRFASQPQRLAAILETLVCAWPGCSVAGSKCQIHHMTAVKHGGLTTGENLTPLCKKHNGRNDDDPGQQVNGRIERDPVTGRPGLRRTPGGPLEFNNRLISAKTIIAHHHRS